MDEYLSSEGPSKKMCSNCWRLFSLVSYRLLHALDSEAPLLKPLLAFVELKLPQWRYKEVRYFNWNYRTGAGGEFVLCHLQGTVPNKMTLPERVTGFLPCTILLYSAKGPIFAGLAIASLQASMV